MAARRQPWFWIYPLLVAGLVACVGGWADRSVRLAVEAKLRSELLTTLEANVTSLDLWIRGEKRLALGIASEPAVVQEALNLLAATNLWPSPQGPGGAPPRTGLEGPGGGRRGAPLSPEARRFATAVDTRMRPAGFFIAQLVSTNGIVIADTGPGRLKIGSSVNEEHQTAFAELFSSGEPVIITPFRPRPDRSRPGGGGRWFRPNGGPPPNGSTNEAGGGPGMPWERDRFRVDRERDRDRERGGSESPSPRLERGSGGGPPPPNAPDGADFRGPPPFEERGFPTNRAGGRTGIGMGPGGGWRPGGGPSGGLMQVAAPLRDADGQLRGALAFMINPELEFSRILSSARQGQSGETYAFDDDGLMLSASRFDAELRRFGLIENRPEATAALTLRLRDPGGDLSAGYPVPPTNAALPLISLVTRAIQGDGTSGVAVVPSRDFRGLPVVGAWRWMTNYHFGVVTQMNASEAFAPLRVLRSIFLILTGLLAVAACAALVNSYWKLVWRRKMDEAELKLKTLGQYTLEEKIGEGAMGVVHKARHALLRRETAVKLLLPDRATEAAIRQFEREVQLTCQLTHPNTIQIYDFGRTPDGVFYYAMEYLAGMNLADLVFRHGPQPEARVLHILAQVCDSLAEAHARGLVHRDIKPANIILCERGGVPDCVKVLDFGLVRPLTDASSAAAAIASDAVAAESDEELHLSGTPLYLPPETIQNPALAEPRGDLYALGAVGYHLLTGQPPFNGPSLGELLRQHVEEPPAPLRERTANPIHAELESLLLRCLAKDPAQRPASASELRRFLSECPGADAWTAEARADWWRRMASVSTDLPGRHAGSEADSELNATVAATLRIDLAGR